MTTGDGETPTFDATVTPGVAAYVEDLRNQRGWSVQHLADRCAEAGQPSLKRSVLVNLQRGRRRYLTIGELMALAAVFDVVPAALLGPPGLRNLFCGQYAVDRQVAMADTITRELRLLQDRVRDVLADVARGGGVDQVQLERATAQSVNIDLLMRDLERAAVRHGTSDDEGSDAVEGTR